MAQLWLRGNAKSAHSALVCSLFAAYCNGGRSEQRAKHRVNVGRSEQRAVRQASANAQAKVQAKKKGWPSPTTRGRPASLFSASYGHVRKEPQSALVHARKAPRSVIVRALRLHARERRAARVLGGVFEFFFDAQQLVVLVDALAAGRCTGLDLAGVHGHR